MLFRYLLVLFIGLLGFSTTLQAKEEIRETDTLWPLFADVALSSAPENTLIITGLDGILIHFDDMIMTSEGRDRLSRFFLEEEKRGTEKEQIVLWNSLITLSCQPHLVESHAGEILERIQDIGAQCLLLTRRSAGSYGYIDDRGHLVLDWLEQLDLPFNYHAEQTNPLSLPVHSETALAIAGYPPAFIEGCLFSALQPKGLAVTDLLDHYGDSIDRVIFINDLSYQIREVYQEMEKRGIPCTGYRYVGIQKLDISYDPAIVELQLSYLRQHNVWLSDDQARAVNAGKQSGNDDPFEEQP